MKARHSVYRFAAKIRHLFTVRSEVGTAALVSVSLFMVGYKTILLEI